MNKSNKNQDTKADEKLVAINDEDNVMVYEQEEHEPLVVQKN